MNESNRIKVRSIEFHQRGFRKLRGLKIEFADRLTVIAGHNGIGKSTILGLVCNTFGLTDQKTMKSCVGEPYYANIERIVYLDLSEVDNAKRHPEDAPTVEAQVGTSIIKKRCAMTRRSIWKRARVVPRTINPSNDDPTGPDAKIPLPTLYLGLRRFASIGEADEKEVKSEASGMHDHDKLLVSDFVRSVMQGVKITDNFTQQTIKGPKKKTAHPGYEHHDAFAVSMGQDSLASIATALASFNHLKREMGPSYPGGLLVVDELDVGFHPHAISRLIDTLKRYAKSLDVQIIATTHSPVVVSAVHPEGDGAALAPDKVVYLVDTLVPRLAEDQSLEAILSDMQLSPHSPPEAPTLFVYFEDEQSKQFFEGLLPGLGRSIRRKYGLSLKLAALGVGGSNLVTFPRKDPVFRNRVIVVDADTAIPGKANKWGNVVKLPSARGAQGTQRSPENLIKTFLRKCSQETDGPFHTALLGLNVTNPTSDRVNQTFFSDGAGDSNDRESSKRWWERNWRNLKRWKVIQQWRLCHQAEVATFAQLFENSAASAARRLKSISRQQSERR